MFGNILVSRHQWENKEETPMPKDVPDVDEVGATSAPLLSASFFIGDRCKPYNDDFMLCKDEHNGGEIDCLKEGRRVTRCAISVLKDINKHCFDEFKLHYECLEQNNQYFSRCRASEGVLSKCVFDKLGLKKTVPGVETQIQEKKNPIYKVDPKDVRLTNAYLKKSESESSWVKELERCNLEWYREQVHTFLLLLLFLMLFLKLFIFYKFFINCIDFYKDRDKRWINKTKMFAIILKWMLFFFWTESL